MMASVTIDDLASTLETRPSVNHRLVSPGYFRAMGIPLLRGREFSRFDSGESLPVAIISESMATRFWPGEDPIGKRVRQGGAEDGHPWVTVVGVVADVAGTEIPETWYLPYAQRAAYLPVSFATLGMALVARTASAPVSLVPAIRRAVSEVDPLVPVHDVASMERVYAEALLQQKIGAWLFGIFAALGLLMAAVGTYGVVSYATSQRTREIGIRMALGTTRWDIVRDVMGRGAILVGAGLILGLLMAFLATPQLSGVLTEVSPRDLETLGTVALLLAVVATLAVFLPTRRATRVDPMIALRDD